VREEVWAANLSLSRTPVREAINRLVIEGLLVRDGRTAYVFQPSIEDLLDIYDMRLALETLAARRAAERGGPALAEGLLQRFDQIKGLESNDDWFRDHEEFHNYLFAGAGSPRLSSMIQVLRAQSEPYVRFAVATDRRFRSESKSQHREMVHMVRKGDGDGIAELVYEHLMRTRREVVNLIEAGWTANLFPTSIAPPLILPATAPRASRG
jgi:DNA-binding GntR family transcriptional regulator